MTSIDAVKGKLTDNEYLDMCINMKKLQEAKAPLYKRCMVLCLEQSSETVPVDDDSSDDDDRSKKSTLVTGIALVGPRERIVEFQDEDALSHVKRQIEKFGAAMHVVRRDMCPCCSKLSPVTVRDTYTGFWDHVGPVGYQTSFTIVKICEN